MKKKKITKKKKAAKKVKRRSVRRAKKRKLAGKKKAAAKMGGKMVTPEKLQEMVYKVKSRGFITYSEILYSFPEIEKDIQGLEYLYDELEKRGIEVKESREFLEVDKGKKEAMKIASEAVLDPVQIYLKEIGEVSFLTADEEKELAKRIEKGEEEAKNKLMKANLRLVVS